MVALLSSYYPMNPSRRDLEGTRLGNLPDVSPAIWATRAIVLRNRTRFRN